LLDNGVRHSRPGGSVIVGVSPVGSEGVLVEVADSCGGIPAADLDRVFETAFRGDVARRQDASGGGLGLTITRGLVELLGGAVHVVNTDVGCRFTVELPGRQTAVVPDGVATPA
jgi:signal transduction histidine kinase